MDQTATASGPQTRERSSATRKRWLGLAVTIVLVASVFGFFLPKLADYRDVWHSLEDLDITGWAALATAAAWNLVALVPLLMVSLPGLRFWPGFVNMTAGTAVANTVPAGGAIGIGVNWAVYDSWGFPPQEYTLASLLSGLWNNFVKLGLPVVALLLLATTGDLRGSYVPAAVVGVGMMIVLAVVFAFLFHSDHTAEVIGQRLGAVARPIGRRFGRHWDSPSWGKAAVGFRKRSIDLVRRRWTALTVTALVGQLSLYIVLLVAVRAVGISQAQVSWAEVLAAFAFVRLISAIPITPGGLGVVELGLTATLSSGESSAVAAKAAAAVLLYRALTYLLPIPLGAGCYVFWRLNKSWRRPNHPPTS